jgi:hypothetical protein
MKKTPTGSLYTVSEIQIVGMLLWNSSSITHTAKHLKP